MNQYLRNTFLALSIGLAGTLTASTAAAQEPLRPVVRDAALETLRAGAADNSARAFVTTERASLAEAYSPSLETLRATDVGLTDDEWRMILITAGIVVLVLIII